MLKQELVSHMSDVSPHLAHYRVLEWPQVVKEPPDERTETTTKCH